MASPEIPSTMKAWLVTKNGEPKTALTLNRSYPVPKQPKAGNLLIKVSHAALNPADLNLMANLPNWIPFRRNPIVGIDFAGTVVKIGGSSTSQQATAMGDATVGTEVCGALNVLSIAIGRGTLAEYIEVPASKVIVKPKSIEARDAVGALGTAGQTAWLVLKESGVKKGDRVLVNGASGGVGSVLVQVAKAKGCVVYGVCSGANEGFVKGLGAEEIIDYKTHDPVTAHLAEKFEKDPVNAIFDCVGSDDLYRKCAGYLSKDGIFVTIVGAVAAVPIARSKVLPIALGGVPRRFKLLALFPDGAIAKEVAKWIEDGEYHTFPMDSEYSMDDVIQGYEKLATKRARGKLVIKVSQ